MYSAQLSWSTDDGIRRTERARAASRNDAYLAKEGGTTGVPLVPVLDEGFFIDIS
ncbi:hypothetical protein KSF_010290 [Reticulibacter mediterranei]|uniref:Uncharacterized protein n=1 Tax=Reticulibacter mediterranei TaxID=2778369 RepID=A0A8J3IJZ8_9CHLR|nr:hypothetical protein KSF_010290 [Reticulibacter mediterranei]